MSNRHRQQSDGAQPSGGGTAEADLARASGRADAQVPKASPPRRRGRRIHGSNRQSNAIRHVQTKHVYRPNAKRTDRYESSSSMQLKSKKSYAPPVSKGAADGVQHPCRCVRGQTLRIKLHIAAAAAAKATACCFYSLLPLLLAAAAAAAVTAAFLLSAAGWVPALAAGCGCCALLLGALFL